MTTQNVTLTNHHDAINIGKRRSCEQDAKSGDFIESSILCGNVDNAIYQVQTPKMRARQGERGLGDRSVLGVRD
ncbi:MAG: hypothetical protein SO434_06285 [Eubacteriales bacterium]|nr:hypothetical protein [Eubacteriales bacterium]